MTQSSNRHALSLALTTGLVSAFFSVVYQAIEEFLTLAPHEQLKELIVIAVTSVGMLLAIEPILERIGPDRVHASFRREDDVLIRAGALLTIIATSLLHGLLHSHISESLSAHGMVVLEQLLTALIAPTLITLSWIRGAEKKPSQAKWYGLMAGLLAGLGLVVLAMVQLYFFRPPSGIQDASPGDAVMTLLGIAASFLWFIVPICILNGCLGGVAIDRRWSGRAWRAVAIGLLTAVAIEAGLFFLISLGESHAMRPADLLHSESLTSLVVEVAIANLGWAIGLWVRPDADALVYGAAQAQTGRDG